MWDLLTLLVAIAIVAKTLFTSSLPPPPPPPRAQEVSVQLGAELADQYRCEIFETSAKNNTGVEEAFQMMARLVVQVRLC